MNKKRLLIISDSVSLCTGYSVVANNVIANLLKIDKYIIGALGFSDIPVPIKYPIYYYSQLKDHAQCCNRGPIIEYVKPGDTKRSYLIPTIQGDCPPDHPNQNFCLKGQNIKNDHYGLDSSYFVIQHFKPDIVIPINDIWGLYHLNHLKNRSCYKFIPYLAIDSECLFPQLQPPESRPGLPVIDTIRTIGSTNGTIVFTDWAKEVINKTCRVVTSGRELNNISVIPHGVDTSIWKPITEEERKEYRKKYFNIDPEKDNIFLLICLGRLQPRKRQDALIQTMRKFIDKFEKPNKKLMCYFHCSLEDMLGWDLPWLASYYGVQDRIIFNKDLKPGIGPTNEEMRKIVGATDAHSLLYNSEGWCSLPGANVLTTEGYKNIEEITLNDFVISHTGKIQKVINPLSRNYSGEMIEFKTFSNGPSVTLTPNHKLYAYRNNKFEWIEAQFINSNDKLCFPIPKICNNINNKIDLLNYIKTDYKLVNNLIYGVYSANPLKIHHSSQPVSRYIDVDNDFCNLLGNFLSEGCASKRNIKFCLNQQESDNNLRINIFNFCKKYNLRYIIENNTRNRQVITISSNKLSVFFKCFGHKAKNKYIPDNIMKIILSDHKLIQSLLSGLIESDGSSYIDSNDTQVINFTSTSKKLCSQTRLLLHYEGIHSSIYKSKRGEWSLVIQEKNNLKKLMFISKNIKISSSSRKSTAKYEIIDNNFVYKIKSINKINYNGIVYNLSVEQDQSYIIEGITVHNCLPALETMACGIPNIITNYSAPSDWAQGNALFVNPAEYEHEPRTNFIKAVPDTLHAAKQIKLIYDSKELWKDYSKRGVALAKKLEWSNVCKQWEEYIDNIDISDLKEGRYSSPEALPEMKPQQPDYSSMSLKYLPQE